MKKYLVSIVVIIAMSLSACNMLGSSDAGNQQYFDSNIVTAKVKAALIQDPDIRNNNIGVSTYHGQVQLSGFVDSKAEVKKAARIAASIPGVLKVKNNLVVKK